MCNGEQTTSNFERNERRGYVLSGERKLEKKEKETMTKEEIESAVKEIIDNDNEVLAERGEGSGRASTLQ